MTELPDGTEFDGVMIELNEHGRLLNPSTRAEVPDTQVRDFLAHALGVPPDVTDIFVWVHGWQNDLNGARLTAARLAAGIEATYRAASGAYPNLSRFRGYYVAVHWPSKSNPWLSGFERIRDRAHELTTNGYAEYVLASLLGYLDDERAKPSEGPATLRTAGGQYLHCVGHSFGGRFLCEAIAAAATPSPPVLALLPPNERFAFTVDNLLVFQMAAPPDVFMTTRLKDLLANAPLQGPVTLTFSSQDRANCVFHLLAEGGWRGIGCQGALGPPDQVAETTLRPTGEGYTVAELAAPIVNVDANWLYRGRGWPGGAHSAYWHTESMHLLLTLANFSRT